MNKILNFFIIFLFISNCSLDTKTGLWSQSENLNSEKESIEEKLFVDSEIYEKEFNEDLKIRLKGNFKKNSFVNNLLIIMVLLNIMENCLKFPSIDFQKLVNLIIISQNY